MSPFLDRYLSIASLPLCSFFCNHTADILQPNSPDIHSLRRRCRPLPSTSAPCSFWADDDTPVNQRSEWCKKHSLTNCISGKSDSFIPGAWISNTFYRETYRFEFLVLGSVNVKCSEVFRNMSVWTAYTGVHFEFLMLGLIKVKCSEV